MRIIGGKLKGHTLHLPKNREVRPLKDLARESIFNVLAHSNKISFNLNQSKILDLYAGTGSFGLECLSREAKSVFFVEKEKEAINILEKNINKLKIQNKTKIYFNEIFKLIEQEVLKSKFDLVFCDPPFKDKNTKKLIQLIFYKNLLQKDGIIIIHRNKKTKEKFPDFFKIIEEKIYGISKIIFAKILS